MVMTEQRITTPCPACGAASLFVGTAGHLTCAVHSCPEPGVAQEITNLKATLEDALSTLVAIAALEAGPGQLWFESPTLNTTIVRIRRALRLRELPDPLRRTERSRN